jgi:hypothetical protein
LYPVLLGYRWDYLSHFLIGAGTVLGAVGAGRAMGWRSDGIGAGVAVAVVAASLYTEHRWFGALVFDLVDIGAGGLGACCAAAALLGSRGKQGAGTLLAAAIAATAAGFALRFGVGGLPG